jgi:hypothetical protein
MKGTMMRILVLTLLLCILITTAIATTQNSVKPPFKLVATVSQVMTAITAPASDIIFHAVSGVPQNDTEWKKVQNSALELAESGNLLMLPGRSRDNVEWVKQSQALIEAAMLALKAAREKNADNLMIAGDKIIGTCEGCHNKYMDKSR